MLQRPRVTVVGVPPCARTMPAARLLAPSPARPCSRTTTRSAPDVLAKYEAQPPTVPAPTITRSARSPGISLASGPYYRASAAPTPTLPRKGGGRNRGGRGRARLGDVASADDEPRHGGEDHAVERQHQHRLACGDQRRRSTRRDEDLAQRLNQRVRVLPEEALLDCSDTANVEPTQQANHNRLDRKDVREAEADRHRRLPEEIRQRDSEQAP